MVFQTRSFLGIHGYFKASRELFAGPSLPWLVTDNGREKVSEQAYK